jgi:hypothetical protein
MTQETKRVSVESEGTSEEEAKKDVVNDSLGTVDTADSTGLDSDDPRDERPAGKET